MDEVIIRDRLVGIYTILQAGQTHNALERIEQWVNEIDKEASEITVGYLTEAERTAVFKKQ